MMVQQHIPAATDPAITERKTHVRPPPRCQNTSLARNRRLETTLENPQLRIPDQAAVLARWSGSSPTGARPLILSIFVVIPS